MNKAINHIILFSIFAVPLASIIPIHGTIVWYPQLLMLMLVGFASLAFLFWDNNKYISMFLIYGAFSYLVVCNQSPRAMLCIITGSLGILFAYLVSISQTKYIYRCIVIMAAINATMVIAQVFHMDPMFTPDSNNLIDRAVGFMGSRNQIGIFHGAITPILMAFSPYAIFLIFPMLLIKCASAMVGVFAGMITMYALQGKKLISALLFISFLVAIPIVMHLKSEVKSELKERMSLWKLTIQQTIDGHAWEDNTFNLVSPNHREISCNPLFGYGIGNFFVLSPMTQGVIWSKNTHKARYEHAHNDIVEAFFEFGYIGILLILMAMGKIILDFVNALHAGHPNTGHLIVAFSSLVALAFSSCGVYVFHAPVSFFLFCLILGMFYREVNYVKKQSTFIAHTA